MTASARIKSFFPQPRLLINSILLAAFCGALIRAFLYWLPRDAFERSLNYWAYTDWLIDYSQGFIRRGLSGEIWRLLPSDVPHEEFIAVFSWILFLAVACGYVRLLARSLKALHPLTLFGLLFLPSLFFFYLHDHKAIGRKEMLGYVILLLHLFVVEKTLPLGGGFPRRDGSLRRYLLGWAPLAVLLLPAAVLVHEVNFLLFVPLHAMVTLSVLRMTAAGGFRRTALWAGLLYLPAAIAFGAVLLSGTPSYSTLLGICEKWAAAGAIREGTCILPPDKLNGSTLPGSFIPMEWSFVRAAEITRWIISRHWMDWILILPTLAVLLWYLARQTVYAILRFRVPRSFAPRSAVRQAGEFFLRYFAVPLLLSMPVYVTAYDYGRWFTVACVNFALVAVSVNLPAWEYAFRRTPPSAESGSVSAPEHADSRPVFYGASIAAAVLAFVLWLPHYCSFECEILRSPLRFFELTFIAH
ncbi:MAG: hypothetical protein JW929_13365 [Anaerolineales bacterium]|nr:hypothetical protein [Anaerolineales bacterium]